MRHRTPEVELEGSEPTGPRYSLLWDFRGLVGIKNQGLLGPLGEALNPFDLI